MLIGWCGWFLILAVVLAAGDLASAGISVSLACVGLALGAVALLLRNRHRRNPLPSYRRLTSWRAPRTVSGTLTLIGLAMVGLCVATLLWIFDGPKTTAQLLHAAFFIVMAVLFQIILLLVPAWHGEHADALFRAYIDRHPEVRRSLEDLALHGTDPRGPDQFGPL
jgi:hypothetical protein